MNGCDFHGNEVSGVWSILNVTHNVNGFQLVESQKWDPQAKLSKITCLYMEWILLFVEEGRNFVFQPFYKKLKYFLPRKVNSFYSFIRGKSCISIKQ